MSRKCNRSNSKVVAVHTRAYEGVEVSFMPRSFHSPMKDVPVTLKRRLGRPQKWSGHLAERENLLPVTQIELRSLKHQVYSLIATPTKLVWLPDCSVDLILIF
jgi:hypothetical protein